ncbi:hypothetical protein DPMN_038871 [Dreissena polymorpha]|uniref:Uncharacterized protein n=1 Tax=Dreissena polymorpha TaxID=45954 RepID=A0A9D4MG45_DREPO|nr:hypothetical protein DPMN_038871 [Dreissena polymorpha]
MVPVSSMLDRDNGTTSSLQLNSFVSLKSLVPASSLRPKRTTKDLAGKSSSGHARPSHLVILASRTTKPSSHPRVTHDQAI